MAIIWFLMGAILVVAIAVFHAQNPWAANLMLFGSLYQSVPAWLLITVPAVIGLILGMLAMLPTRLRTAWQNRRSGKLMRDMELRLEERERAIQERDQQLGMLQHQISTLQRDLDATREVYVQPATPVEAPEEIPVERRSGLPPSNTSAQDALHRVA